MKSAKRYLKCFWVLVLLLASSINTGANIRNYAQPGLCNVNVEVGGAGNPPDACYPEIWAYYSFHVYWGGISEASTYTTLEGTGSCKVQILCYNGSQQGINCYPYYSYYTGAGGGSGAYFYGTVYSLYAGVTDHQCAPSDPVSYGKEIYCIHGGQDSTTLYGPCRDN